jgi:UDP-N-acetylmuramate--alanine ligase
MVSRPVITLRLGEDAMPCARDVQALPGGQMRFTCQRATACAADACPLTSRSTCRRAQRAQRAGGHRRGHRAGAARRPDVQGAGRSSPAWAGASSATATWLPAAQGGQFTLIDDYGHHPVEMAAVLSRRARRLPGPAPRAGLPAAPLHPHARLLRGLSSRSWAGRRVLLTEVYAAGEPPIVAPTAGAGQRASLRSPARSTPVVRRRVDALPRHRRPRAPAAMW